MALNIANLKSKRSRSSRVRKHFYEELLLLMHREKNKNGVLGMRLLFKYTFFIVKKSEKKNSEDLCNVYCSDNGKMSP